MPHFTLNCGAGAPPIVDAYFHVSEPRWNYLNQRGLTVPNPFLGKALVDTGADGSCIDLTVVRHLCLEERGIAETLTPSTGQNVHLATEYDLAIIIPIGRIGDSSLVMGCLQVIESDLFAKQGIHALIGRDVLQRCIFHYDGSGYFSLAW